MRKATLNAAILSIALDRASGDTLQSQLTQAFRRTVHERRLRSGDRLPSSRTLAQELSISRVTVTAVYDQLISEGYFEGRRGSGVYVATDLPDLPTWTAQDPTRTTRRVLSRPDRIRPFDSGQPDLREFPHREWARLLVQVWRAPDGALLGRPDPLGWAGLRVALARHLRDWRGIQCDPQQVVITSGLLEAIQLISAVFPPGSRVLMEEPGHRVLRRALRDCGFACSHVCVDAQGFDLAHAPHSTTASAVAVTPSRHFPLGMVLPLARRLELLNWASTTGGYILEDDYDGDYRYQGQPLPAMMSLDEDDRVIYIGSFSQVMFPALRLGFMVLPNPLIGPILRNLQWTGARASLLAQPVLAKFMETGSFATHIRRMRRLYAMRQKVLVAAIRNSAKHLLAIEPSPGGMHLVAWPAPDLAVSFKDTEIAASAAGEGVSVQPLSCFYAGASPRQGLVLGYAAFEEAEIHNGVETLTTMIGRQLLHS